MLTSQAFTKVQPLKGMLAWLKVRGARQTCFQEAKDREEVLESVVLAASLPIQARQLFQ